MKAILDFENKTIEIQGEAMIEAVTDLQQHLADWKEWRIVPKMEVKISGTAPHICYTWPCWCGRGYQSGTYIDRTFQTL